MQLNGTRIINARLRRGWSQERLAEVVELSIPTICRAEKGRGVHPSTGEAICSVLDLDLASTVVPIPENDPVGMGQ